MVDFLKHYHRLTGLALMQLLFWLGLSPRKFQRWKDRYGKANEHNAMIPRDHWIEAAERAAIIQFARQYPLEGYRRLTFMMLDRDIAAVSPATTYRVLKAAGLIGSRFLAPSRKGQGFVQPLQPHEHWHVDFSHVNLGGTFYYLCSVLDGASRAILAWDIRPQMREADAEIVIQRAREAYPVARPRIISDNGPQFVAKDFNLSACGKAPTSSARPIILRAMASSNVITAPSKNRLFGPKHRSLSKMPSVSLVILSTITTISGSIRPLDTSPQWTAWPAATTSSSQPVTKNSKPLVKLVESNVNY